jgi:membrane protease YdiL (CAAX protease family)
MLTSGTITPEEFNNRTQPRPWGFWPTLGLSTICCVLMNIVSALVVWVFLEHWDNSAPIGLIFWTTALFADSACLALIFLFVKLRKGHPLRPYLGLSSVRGRQLLAWIPIIFGLLLIYDLSMYMMSRPIVPQFLIDVYSTAYFLPGLLIVILVVAPVFEEIFFRGFMFAGFRSSIGSGWTILLTALIWAVMHTQYDHWGKFFIFLGGIILGIARIKTRSVYTSILLHSLISLVAVIELEVVT